MAQHAAPATPARIIYILFTRRVREICAQQNQWARGQPQGALAQLLARAKPWPPLPRSGDVMFECTQPQAEALHAKVRELHASMRAAGINQRDGAAVAQWARRIREAIAKGTPPVAARAALPGAALIGLDLFSPPPSDPRVQAAYRQHVMESLRELVDFSQSSAYCVA